MKLNHVISLKFLLILLGLTVYQQGAFANFESKSEFAILVDGNTGSVLYEKNADKRTAPASMSKLMTLAIIFQELKRGKLTLEDEIFISENAWRNGGAPSGTSAMFASINSKVKLIDILQGIVVQSGNDACIAIAEALSGSEAAFATRMNEYAAKIGLKQSSFRNSTGLPHPDHLMTVRDLAKLSVHLIKEYPEYYTYFAQKEFRYKRYRFYNRNPLVSRNIGVDGLKTGFTKDSGYGLAASALRKDRRLVVVVNGLATKRERASEAQRLLEWGFNNFTQFRLFEPGQVVTSLRVWGGEKSYVKVTGKDGVRIYLPRFGNQKLRSSVVYNGPLKTPIKKGDRVATFRVTTENGASSEAPLYAAEDVGPSSFVWQGIDSLFFLVFGWAYYAL